MKPTFAVAAAATMAIGILASSAAQEPERQMNVQQGPDSVFAESPERIFPELAGATASGQNGRVGNELVFWGYRLADGTEAYLVACAMIATIDCAARESRVCDTDTRVLARGSADGLVREIHCRSVALVAPGDRRPGCSDGERAQALAVSLLSCQ